VSKFFAGNFGDGVGRAKTFDFNGMTEFSELTEFEDYFAEEGGLVTCSSCDVGGLAGL
jgi:hypothetical protein